ncbi:hypothetical protein [Nocardioides daeguensis]|uniref:Uncharacterized protein n=1 Tax=Nocardioides daeguensis TaxID=908359 RepID=A0ABP6W3S3_9ACTN|nr:hypothetical protein [Nocardioides daeguensis]MBV6727722.1 hypothetical protein [Nocardioides daeguensis]MCR1775194.1 hypothetical protein [Nocardioides daeguensis]
MRTRVPAALAALALAGTVLAGCGSASAPSAPTGVDGLVIPTPDPGPADFVAAVDNPWFPLEPGSRWEYADLGTGQPALTLTVETGPDVAGIATTTLVRTGADGGVVRDLYAQDRAGNVWWFGRVGEWQAGENGAEAGLAMPATPRVGDGFRTASAPGLAEVATVRAMGEKVTVPLASYDTTVRLEVEDAAGGRTEVYARGTGLVRTGEAGLVAYEPGQQ